MTGSIVSPVNGNLLYMRKYSRHPSAYGGWGWHSDCGGRGGGGCTWGGRIWPVPKCLLLCQCAAYCTNPTSVRRGIETASSVYQDSIAPHPNNKWVLPLVLDMQGWFVYGCAPLQWHAPVQCYKLGHVLLHYQNHTAPTYCPPVAARFLPSSLWCMVICA